MSAYLGFAADLRQVLDRMPPLAEEYGDEWKAAAALIPRMDTAVRDQLATEHLVRCYRLAHDIPDRLSPLPEAERVPGTRKVRSDKGRPHRNAELLRTLGLSAKTVKQWAVTQGLLPEVKRGTVRLDLIEAYVLAHQDAIPAPDQQIA